MELALAGAVTILVGFALGFFMGRKINAKPVDSKALIEAETKLALILEEKNRLLDKLIDIEKDNAGLLVKLGDNSQISTQFENLANKIFDQKTSKFGEQTEKNLNSLLNPLKERIMEFQKRVEDTYSHESRERFALKSEIEKIVEANTRITLEAGNLTRALKGDSKAQGNWGEVMLERILESSGLRKDQEYITQGRELELKNEDGRTQQPDVVVFLPDEKHLIIDSKVSLTHYERFISAVDDAEKSNHQKSFLNSIYSHISDLSGKKYQHQEKLFTPDFVMLFFPIEGAFSMAVQADAELFNFAWSKSIVIVSPSTLLATLRTVASIWKHERQNKNVMEIARQSGALYDKFVSFTESLKKIDDGIVKTREAYDEAFNRIQTGKGNLVARVESIKKLGAKTSKSLPAGFQLEDENLTELE